MISFSLAVPLPTTFVKLQDGIQKPRFQEARLAGAPSSTASGHGESLATSSPKPSGVPEGDINQ